MIEPGVLALFRRYILVLFGLTALGLCGLLEDRTDSAVNINRLLNAALTTVLALYVLAVPMRRWLGRVYLPLGLIMASAGPLLAETAANVLAYERGWRGALVDPGGLYLWLLPPLLLISTQYRYRALVLYCAAISLGAFGLLLLQYAWIGRAATDAGAGIVIRLLLFAFSGVFIVYLSDAGRKQRHELAEKNAQIAGFAATLEALAVSRERNRLARELHDTLAHTLSAVSVQLKALDVLIDSDPAAARAALAQTHTLTRDGLGEARRALHDLRAAPITDLGLLLAVQRLAEAAAGRAGTALKLMLPPGLPMLPAVLEQQVYRVAEEALNNAVRHANARTLLLELSVQAAAHAPPTLRLVIADDGRGFDPTAAPDGRYGLRGMHERASLIDGTLTAQSAPGAGTRITLTAPLPVSAQPVKGHPHDHPRHRR